MTETDKPSVSCVSAKSTHTRTAERKEQITYSCQAERCVRLMQGMSGERGESLVHIKNSKTNQSWSSGWRRAPGDQTFYGQTKMNTARSFNLMQPEDNNVSSEVSLPDLLPQGSFLGQNYWQNVGFTGWLWKSLIKREAQSHVTKALLRP